MNRKHVKNAAVLKYDRLKDLVPKVTAKGHAKSAEKFSPSPIRIKSPWSKITTWFSYRMRWMSTTEIPPELYRAVAEALAFIYRMNVQLIDTHIHKDP